MNAYNQGWNSYYLGACRDHNPYPRQTESADFVAWYTGWSDAMERDFKQEFEEIKGKKVLLGGMHV